MAFGGAKADGLAFGGAKADGVAFGGAKADGVAFDGAKADDLAFDGAKADGGAFDGAKADCGAFDGAKADFDFEIGELGRSILADVNVGIQLQSLRMPLKKALLTAARLGAQGIEIDARNDIRPEDLSDTGRRQLRKMLDDLNLRVAAVRFHTARGYDVAENLERRVDGTKQAMRFAYSLGASVVVNQIGVVPEEPASDSHGLLVQCLTDLARYGQHVGAMLAAETGSEPGERLAAFLDSLRETALGITFNPGNLIVNNFSVEDALARCATHTLLVHAKDAVRDLARGRGVEVPLGRGMAEFPQIMASLEERHYRGWYVIERDYSEDIVESLSYAVQFLRNL